MERIRGVSALVSGYLVAEREVEIRCFPSVELFYGMLLENYPVISHNRFCVLHIYLVSSMGKGDS